MFGWLWGCLMLIKVDLGQLPIDTFATDQPTDPFAIPQYNDRNRSAPTVRRFHLWHFIMPSFAPNNLIHIVSRDFGRFRPRLMLPIEPRGVTVTWPISKKMKILDFLKFGQRCLGWFWLIERLSVLAQIDVWMALGLSNVDQSWSETTSYWHICHRPANRPFCLDPI